MTRVKIKDTKSYKELLRTITKLVRESKNAEKLGFITCGRELYECSNCGWMEDVDIDGRLFSTFENHPEIKDYNLKVVENISAVVKGEKYYQCPNCRRILI